VRLGDVIAGNEWHEKCKRPLSLEYYKKHTQASHVTQDPLITQDDELIYMCQSNSFSDISISYYQKK
jgi:hypothetical protein